MCLIVDANCAGKLANAHADAAPVAKWLLKTSSKLVVGGGQLAAEYARITVFVNLLAELKRRGQVKLADDRRVDQLERTLKKNGALASDDPHIVALATVSGSRLLFSNDKALHADFGALSPKGKVYQRPSHSHLLTQSTC